MRNKLFLVGFCWLVASCSQENSAEQKIAFVDSMELFESYSMKKEYDRILEGDMKAEGVLLDSISVLLQNAPDSNRVYALRKDYYVAEQLFNTKFDQLSQKYTTIVTERLNEVIKQFSKEKGYSMVISGADGNVLYVEDAMDVTKDLIDYANVKFSE